MHSQHDEESWAAESDDALEKARRFLGATSTRLDILCLTLASRETTTAKIMVQLNLSRSGVLQHLRALEREGLLSARHATHPRGSGPITYWRADVDEVVDLMEEFTDRLRSLA